MKNRIIKIFKNLKFAIFILILIAFFSSLGSIIEQNQNLEFYKKNYPIANPIFGFLNYKIILFLGFDHIYESWWFLSLLASLGLSLTICTGTTQFPTVKNSRQYFLKTKTKSFFNLIFKKKKKNFYYLRENILKKIKSENFYSYQTKNFFYGYKGLIGRISPIFVHISLLVLLIANGTNTFESFNAQEIIPKGESFHIQNFIKIGNETIIPGKSIRLNDFWINYKNKEIHQFYSSISLIDNIGNEKINKTISVNNPLKIENIEIYQSDWGISSIRIKKLYEKQIIEYPLFKISENSKIWITWIKLSSLENYTLVFDQLRNNLVIYNKSGNLIENKQTLNFLDKKFNIIENIATSGILIKYQPSINLIYNSFVGLMITTLLSYIPYNQFWILKNKNFLIIGTTSNREKIELEIQFEKLSNEILNFKLKTKLLIN